MTFSFLRKKKKVSTRTEHEAGKVIIIVYSQLITHRELTKTNNNTLTTKIHEKLRKEVEEVIPF